jgi:hypothetical protein
LALSSHIYALFDLEQEDSFIVILTLMKISLVEELPIGCKESTFFGKEPFVENAFIVM